MVKPFKFFQNTSTMRWRTASGLTYLVGHMSIDHIVSVIRCLDGDGDMIIPNPYQGRTHDEWSIIFDNELRRRNETI